MEIEQWISEQSTHITTATSLTSGRTAGTRPNSTSARGSSGPDGGQQPVVGPSTPEQQVISMYPFRWQPGNGRRHATLQRRPRGGFAPDARVEMLCGALVTVDDSELAWFWLTCYECDRAARDMVGLPPQTEPRER